ncbi:MAG: ABC transporter permease [Ruminococcus sp.]|nr:ABC transporter permease [Ruminococcus sp.]
MFLHILKKDLRRKKTMNIIVLLFVILSAMFASSSVNNIVTVMGGIDNYFEKAGISDVAYFFLTSEKGGGDTLTEKLRAEPSVTDIMRENVFYIHASGITIDGEKAMDFTRASVLQRVGETDVKYFDPDNNEITSVPEGGVYISSSNPERAGLRKGDKLSVKIGGKTAELEFLGRAKDAMLGSNFMDNPRLLVSDKVFEEFKSDEEAAKRMGGVLYVKSDDKKAVSEASSSDTSIIFDGDDSVVRTTYIMEILVAAMLLIVSVVLILIAFVVLRFTIGFTIAEEFREIGVMKAIGLKNRYIRSLYLVKYLGMAEIGAGIGYMAGIPFGRLMLGSAEQSMVLGNNSQVLIGAIAAKAVVIIILLFCYSCTRKIKKLSPIDAVRNGQTGERFRKHSLMSLSRSRLGTGSFLPMNDVVSQPRQYGILTAIFTLFLLLVMILANTANTLASDKLLFTLGCTRSDLYYHKVEESMNIMGGKDYREYVNECEKKLADAGIPGKMKTEFNFKVPAEFGDVKQNITMMWCEDTDASDYVYERGTAPQNAHEFATTPMICEEFGFDIGDKVRLTVNGKTEEYLLTAVFQSLNQLGRIGRLHQDAPMNYGESSNAFGFQIDFDDHPDAKTIEDRKETVKELLNVDKVFNAAEFVDDCTNSASAIATIKNLLLILTLMIIAMVSVLMERSFITREKAEIALMKALGFKDRSIMLHHTVRFIIVGAAAGILSFALCRPLTKLVIDPIFGMMGASEGIEYEIRAGEVFGFYPVLIIAVIAVSAFITALYTKTVKASDTANIE